MRRALVKEDVLLIQRLEVILGELECHFHYLINDAQIDESRNSYEATALARKLKLVKSSLTIAILTMRDQSIFVQFDKDEKPKAAQRRAVHSLG